MTSDEEFREAKKKMGLFFEGERIGFLVGFVAGVITAIVAVMMVMQK